MSTFDTLHPRSVGLPATSNVVHTGKVLAQASKPSFLSSYLHFKAVSRAIHSRHWVNTLKSEYTFATTRFYLRRTSLMMSTITSCNGGVLSSTPCFQPRVSTLKAQGNDSGTGRRFYEPSNIVCDYLMWLSGGATELCGLEPDCRYLQMQNDCVRIGMWQFPEIAAACKPSYTCILDLDLRKD
jgi:hypothetical protein